MKKIWISSLLSLIGFTFSIDPLYCETTAYSPSIPGQPLIFHTTNPSLSPIEKKILKQLSNSKIRYLQKLSRISQSISEELAGLIGTVFLPIDQLKQEIVSSIYLSDIENDLQNITAIFAKTSRNDLLGAALQQTLSKLVLISNQMLINTAIDPNIALFQENYVQMQELVINPFKLALSVYNDSLKNLYLKAEAKSALEALVSCITLIISNTSSIVNGDNPGTKNLVLARQQIVKNLIILVETTYVLQVLTTKKCG
jgi:hypothetical protein